MRNCDDVRIQFTSNTEGMTSLERLSKDIIPSISLQHAIIGYVDNKQGEISLQKRLRSAPSSKSIL